MELIQEFWQALLSGSLPAMGVWSYALLFLLVALEGPTATLLGAVLASRGALQPQWVFVAAVAGNTLADLGWYVLGYQGRIDALIGRFAWLRKRIGPVEHLQAETGDHLIKILLVAKLTLSMVNLALIAAGIARIPLRRWFPLVFLIECLWTGGLVLVGFYVGANLQKLESGLQVVAVVGAVILVGFIVWLVRRRRHKAANAE